MGKLRHGFMTMRDLGWTMMLQENGVLQCSIVPMELGKHKCVSLLTRSVSSHCRFNNLFVSLKVVLIRNKQRGRLAFGWVEPEWSIYQGDVFWMQKTIWCSAGCHAVWYSSESILAAGEDNQIKFWDVDSTCMLTCIEADGGLPVSLCTLLSLLTFFLHLVI